MLLHSIYTLANLALKETVSPQSRISPHVTVKKIYSECKKYIEYSEKFQGKLFFSG